MMGLHYWHVEMFEKFGWMVLSKMKGGMDDKVNSYKKSVSRLYEKLECKIAMVSEPDRKDDLEILLNNVQMLKEACAKML
jgi:hypothetical protein